MSDEILIGYKALDADIEIELGYLGMSLEVTHDVRIGFAGFHDPVEAESLDEAIALAEKFLGRPIQWIELYA